MLGPGSLADVLRGAGISVLAFAGPALVVATVVGVGIGLVQAIFNVQEQAIAFAAKVAALIFLLMATVGWSFGYVAHWAHGVLASL